METSLIMRALLGQKREQRALEETAKPIKNVLVPFLIILEKKINQKMVVSNSFVVA